jgi:hypothetical protein
MQTTKTQSLCYSNAEWLNKQIEYASSQFSLAVESGHESLMHFWADRWNRLERHHKDLRQA